VKTGDDVKSKGVSEILAGTIRGQGGKSTCMVSALNLTRRGSKDVIYTDYRIRDVAEILQDGSYQLTVNGETLPLHLVNGRWSIARPSTHS
jgi:hypothetical protein